MKASIKERILAAFHVTTLKEKTEKLWKKMESSSMDNYENKIDVEDDNGKTCAHF